jgi:Flp pilus assembly pilin Flp
MKAVAKTIKSLWRDESAQGATEYILLVVVIVGIVIAFKQPIMDAVTEKIGQLRDKMGQVQ